MAMKHVEAWDHDVLLRGDGSDLGTLDDVLMRPDHLPPDDLEDVHLILDLGAYIGLTALDLNAHYPDARIVAAELYPMNSVLLGYNVRHLANVVVCPYGVAAETGDRLMEVNQHGHNAHRLSPWGSVSMPVKSVDDMLALCGLADTPIDYIKMDIEGAEWEVLSAGGHWLDRTRCMKVELHHGLSYENVSRLLSTQFDTQPDDRHPACVVARRAMQTS